MLDMTPLHSLFECCSRLFALVIMNGARSLVSLVAHFLRKLLRSDSALPRLHFVKMRSRAISTKENRELMSQLSSLRPHLLIQLESEETMKEECKAVFIQRRKRVELMLRDIFGSCHSRQNIVNDLLLG